MEDDPEPDETPAELEPESKEQPPILPAREPNLIYHLIQTSPITRSDMFTIAFLTCLCFVWVAILGMAIAFGSLAKAIRKALPQISD